ncbi:MAG: hypothetical protein RL017_882 [Pseudomonadota bacterium]|jgi:phosphate acetyltransferase
MQNLDFLFKRCQEIGPITAGFVYPCSQVALSSCIEAYQQKIFTPLIIGPKASIETIASTFGLDISPLTIIDVKNEIDAAATAATLAQQQQIKCIIKGSLHTDILLHAILDNKYNLRTNALLSSCCLMHLPTYNRLIFIADMVINIAPDLAQKVHILENAVTMANSLGWKNPKVAVIAAVENINFKMPATLDAAIMAKMGDRGQIKNCIIDGPLDFDLAVSAVSAQIKQFKSPIMGDADILILPDLQAANSLYKEMVFMGGADAADVILGAKIPIVVTSRSDDARTRLNSCAAAAIIAHQQFKA